MKNNAISRLATSAAAIVLLCATLGAALPPSIAAAAPSPAATPCYTANGAKVCVTVTTPTPAPTPTPRIVTRTVTHTVTRTVTKVVTIPVRVPVIERQTVTQRVPVVQVKQVVRVVHAQATAAPNGAYPPGGRALNNGFHEYPMDGRSIDIGINPQAFGLFMFPKGAKITQRAVQDQAHWDVPWATYGPDDRALLAVKTTSTEPFSYPGHTPHDIRTQLVVTTDKNRWPLIISLHTSSSAPIEGTKIGFYDPSSVTADDLLPSKPQQVRAGGNQVAIAPTPTPMPTLPPVAAPCSLEGPTMFYLRGNTDSDFRPTNVFEDTQGHTCIAIPRGAQNAPVVLKSENDGDEVLNSYPWNAGLFVVGTPAVLILQDGSGRGSHRIYIVKDTRTHHP